MGKYWCHSQEQRGSVPVRRDLESQMTDSTLIHPSFESMADKRHADLVRFYTILTNLKAKIGDARKLASCSGGMDWPSRPEGKVGLCSIPNVAKPVAKP